MAGLPRSPVMAGGQWDESKHKRGQPGNKGEFGPGGGGGSASAKPVATPEGVARVKEKFPELFGGSAEGGKKWKLGDEDLPIRERRKLLEEKLPDGVEIREGAWKKDSGGDYNSDVTIHNENGKRVGLIELMQGQDEDQLFIKMVMVDSSERGKGYGKHLLNHVINSAISNGVQKISGESDTEELRGILDKRLGKPKIHGDKDYLKNEAGSVEVVHSLKDLYEEPPKVSATDHSQLLSAVRAERIARRIEAVTAAEGQGHQFHGNQWTKVSGYPEDFFQPPHAEAFKLGKGGVASGHFVGLSKSGIYYVYDKSGRPMTHLGIRRGQGVRGPNYNKNNARPVSFNGRNTIEEAVEEVIFKQPKIQAQDATPDNYHEKARVVAEGIYKAEIDGWLSELNFKTVSGIKRRDDLDEIIAGLAAMGVAWFLAMMLAAKKARKTTARALSAHQGFANTPDEDVLEAFAASRKQPLEAFPEAVRVKVAESLKRGLEGGESPKALARRANEVFNEISEGAAQRVAATEAQVTYGVSQAEALALAGYRSKVWVTMGDDRVRDSHLLCEDQGAVPVSSPFQNGLMFPGDPNGPAEEVINCRCNLEGVK